MAETRQIVTCNVTVLSDTIPDTRVVFTVVAIILVPRGFLKKVLTIVLWLVVGALPIPPRLPVGEGSIQVTNHDHRERRLLNRHLSNPLGDWNLRSQLILCSPSSRQARLSSALILLNWHRMLPSAGGYAARMRLSSLNHRSSAHLCFSFSFCCCCSASLHFSASTLQFPLIPLATFAVQFAYALPYVAVSPPP